MTLEERIEVLEAKIADLTRVKKLPYNEHELSIAERLDPKHGFRNYFATHELPKEAI